MAHVSRLPGRLFAATSLAFLLGAAACSSSSEAPSGQPPAVPAERKAIVDQANGICGTLSAIQKQVSPATSPGTATNEMDEVAARATTLYPPALRDVATKLEALKAPDADGTRLLGAVAKQYSAAATAVESKSIDSVLGLGRLLANKEAYDYGLTKCAAASESSSLVPFA